MIISTKYQYITYQVTRIDEKKPSNILQVIVEHREAEEHHMFQYIYIYMHILRSNKTFEDT